MRKDYDMSKLRILLAEDDSEPREIFSSRIREYFANSQVKYEYVEAASYDEASTILKQSREDRNYFDVFFSDIDFSEGVNTGERASGYELIKEAFNICPGTLIITFSGQFRSQDLWGEYENLKNLGLIIKTMDKSHSDGGTWNWYFENFKEIFENALSNKIMHGIWKNHSAILEKLSGLIPDNDQSTGIAIKNTIQQNLESVFVLQKNLDRIDEKSIFFRLMIYLYHASLEVFLKGEKQNQTIVRKANRKKQVYHQLLRDAGYLKDRELVFSNRCSALHVIVAECRKDLFLFAYLLNMYRNNSIHENKNFRLDQINVLFAHLTLAVCVLDRREIAYDEIERFAANLSGVSDLARRDFNTLIQYLKS